MTIQKRDIIAIGGSAGALDALKVIAGGLQADLPCAILVTTHIGAGIGGKSYMADILSKAGPMPARHPVDGEKIKNGVIYIAPPDQHMTIAHDEIRLQRGPKENMSRPAINPLFRSVAHSFGTRAAGIILSGMLDDGVAGLAEIKRHGGFAAVQDPNTAAYRAMPQNALNTVEVDKIASVAEIAGLITELAKNGAPSKPLEDKMEEHQVKITCPECRGPLWKKTQGRIVEYECRVGHRYSPLALNHDHNITIERSLWSLLVAIEEAAEMSESLGAGDPSSPYLADALRRRNQAEEIRAMLLEDQKNSVELP